MKRVDLKILADDRVDFPEWFWNIKVDGEYFANGTAATYLDAAYSAHGYLVSLGNEASADVKTFDPIVSTSAGRDKPVDTSFGDPATQRSGIVLVGRIEVTPERVDIPSEVCIEVHVCPECVARKCRNCRGDAWCNAEDALTACGCDEPAHLRTDAGA